LLYLYAVILCYRSGAVHEGDEVLSIDNISLSKCTADDATQILQNTSDVVRVKIKKHDHNGEQIEG